VSKNVAMFVDVANMYYAARGQDVDVDYVALLKHATKGRDLIRAYAYTGLDPENENQRKFIDFLGKNGYKPVVKDIRKFGDGRMKANLDIELVVDLFRLADRMDIAVIVSGDGDFAPAIRALQDTGVRCEVISFKPNTSSDLISVADEFMDIMKIASISRKEGRAIRGMSAPEMPAKEVNPEFGFREASPSVAAAALAAIRSSDGGRPTNGRRRSTSRRTEEAEPVSAEAAVATTETESAEETHRRRRRRGGRGRGRGRHETAAESAADEATAPAEGEIGWEEFDDLGQLEGVAVADEGEDAVPGFEEADAATLAELGLTPEEIAELSRGTATEATAATEEEAPKRRRSTRTTKKADEGAEATAATEEEAPKRRRPTRTTKKADEGAEATAATEEEAPKRRRSTRTTKKADQGAEATAAGDDGEGGEGQPQGIWGRFRSARTSRGGTTS
jgi:uncharacterized LabA/DUF88 family protein